MAFGKDLMILLRTRIPIIHIVSYEETRIIKEITALTSSQNWTQNEGVYSWDIADQFACHVESNPKFDVSKPATPDTILEMIDRFSGGAVFILKDFHQIWEAKKSTIRKLRNLASRLPTASSRKTLIIITPEPCLPVELKEDVVTLDLAKPDAEMMEDILENAAGRIGALKGMVPDFRKKIIETALGLSSTQAARVFKKAVVMSRNGILAESCIDIISEEKRQIIRESGALEFYPYTAAEDSIGGLKVLKKWLWERRLAFTEKAVKYGLDSPRGLALIGIPGTGKSLCARMMAGMWKLPLLRLDMGAVFGGLLGASEKNIREAIQISEIISPCILWVDEIEKAFAGSTGDSGTASRVLATFLTWMAEKRHPVFVFATANNIERLPPEFLRKGRFDEVFFLDIPTKEEALQILEVHIKKKGYAMISQRFDLNRIAQAAKGFVGAELEAVVKDAMFPAFLDGERELTTDDLLKAANDMVPMAKSHAAVIADLRKLVQNGQARNASAAAPEETVNCEAIRNSRFIDV